MPATPPGRCSGLPWKGKVVNLGSKTEKLLSPGNSENDDINNIRGWRNHFYRRSEAVAFVMDPEKFDLDLVVVAYCQNLTLT